MKVESLTHRLANLSRALADAGAVLLPADAGVRDPFASEASDILHALCASPYARGVIARAAARCAVGSSALVEPVVGRLVMPVQLPRVLTDGRFVAVTLLTDALECSTAADIARRAGMDSAIATKLLEMAVPCDRRGCGRLVRTVANLVRAEGDRLSAYDTGAQLSGAWEELHLLHSLMGRMAVESSPREFVLGTLDEVRQTLGCRWTALRVDASAAELLQEDEGTVLVSGDDGGDAQKLLSRSGPVARAAVVGTNLVVAPSRRESQEFGLVAAADRIDGDGGMSSCERTLVETAAGNLAVFLDNARLYRDSHRMFVGVMSALVSAIDLKDPYTKGHSRRVALLSRQIAVAAGLGDAEVENIYIAGLMHDIGKIGVPEAVLCKQGKLTDEEYLEVKKHPENGWKLLSDLPLPEAIPQGVRSHHERFDGKGYPQGLAGFDIPLSARIICIADTFDAMSSTRTYRTARSREAVLAEMSKLGGTQFDAEFLAHFLSLDLSAYDAISEERPTPKHPHTHAPSIEAPASPRRELPVPVAGAPREIKKAA